MSFSDLFPRDVEEHEQPPEAHERPEWLGPPEGELGVAVPLNLVLARSERGVVAVSHAIAYSTGLSLQVVARAGGLEPRTVRRFFHEHHGPFDGDDLPESLLRLGVELAGGVRVSNLGGRRPFRRGGEGPSAPVLLEHGGGGGQSSGTSVSWSPAFWLWPLPSAGPVRLYCEWPVAGIPLTQAEIDAAPLVAAAARSMPLREDERQAGPWTRRSSSSSFQYMTAQGTAAGGEEAEAETVTVPAAELRAVRESLRAALQALQRLAR